MKILKLTSAILALCFWFSSFFLWQFLDSHESTVPVDGRIFPLETHGSIVFLTRNENILLYSLIIVGAVFFLLTAVLAFIGRRRSH